MNHDDPPFDGPGKVEEGSDSTVALGITILLLMLVVAGMLAFAISRFDASSPHRPPHRPPHCIEILTDPA